MTSYQKLKKKNEYLESQLNIFKNALTIVRKTDDPRIIIDDGKVIFTEQFAIQRNDILDDRVKQELQKWVAFNLDEETVLKLLEMRKEYEQENN